MSIHVLHLDPQVFPIDRLQPAGARILAALDDATTTCGVDLVVKCVTKGHPVADPHTLGEAADVSVRDLAVAQIVAVKQALERQLGPLFTVIYETPATTTDPALLALTPYVNAAATAPHLHVQRRRGTTYPPPPTAAARAAFDHVDGVSDEDP